MDDTEVSVDASAVETQVEGPPPLPFNIEAMLNKLVNSLCLVVQVDEFGDVVLDATGPVTYHEAMGILHAMLFKLAVSNTAEMQNRRAEAQKSKIVIPDLFN